MEENNWDLSVVVRSCNSNGPNNVTTPNLGLVSFENDDWNDKLFFADMPNFNDLSKILSIDFSVAHQEKIDDQVIIMDQNNNQETYSHPIQPTQINQQIILPPPPPTITCVATKTTTPQELIDRKQQLENFDDHVIIMDQNNYQEMYLHPLQQNQFNQQIFLPSLPTTITCMSTTTATSQELINLQQQPEKLEDQVIIMDQNNNQEMHLHPIQPTEFGQQFFLPSSPITTTKNQSTRVIYEVLQEEFTNDKWAWRKCGQKSIKGSPFPRNYFKCSTSRLCEAKKIIEKNPKNENYLLVSYSGEHNHDPPTYRRSLALYNNSSKNKLPKSINIVPKALNLNASLSSSKRAKRLKVDASSISQIATTLEIERNNKTVDVVTENKDDGDEEENAYDNFFMGFEEFQEVTSSILWE
ncbi:hypothetical protein H5410_016940 [Solanum commersonii]|uniref:WRKY domain-containing protein n=1 Tax=Solanum commersonii TaxID=4109 RepID=A0A9J5ZYU8_SOLCO|nr:hypothetical protein H5410_016940 [Solanum commersonii]